MNSARHELVIMVVEDHNFQRKALMHPGRDRTLLMKFEQADRL